MLFGANYDLYLFVLEPMKLVGVGLADTFPEI